MTTIHKQGAKSLDADLTNSAMTEPKHKSFVIIPNHNKTIKSIPVAANAKCSMQAKQNMKINERL